jgi:hypothetical protein
MNVIINPYFMPTIYILKTIRAILIDESVVLNYSPIDFCKQKYIFIAKKFPISSYFPFSTLNNVFKILIEANGRHYQSIFRAIMTL